jgi:2-polyprenyl-3-methyl-5-hydroxy-6-metoxy-1,4-benzoquinol methylase
MTEVQHTVTVADQSPVEVQLLADGDFTRIHIRPKGDRSAASGPGFLTRYDRELIATVLELKGPEYLCDEIARDENPRYVEAELMSDLLAYRPEAAFHGARILDFGCGCGASTMIMARHFPTAQILGVDLSAGAIELARARRRFYGVENVDFSVSSDRAGGARDIPGDFDFVVLNAVFEHLLPDERRDIVEGLWRRLRNDGVLFVNETPYRYWFRETHTTGLYLINYLPDRLAAFAARRFSRRTSADASWPELLRAGIRGGSEAEFTALMGGEAGSGAEVLEPRRIGLRDRIDLRCQSGASRVSSTPTAAVRSVWPACSSV